MVRKFCYTFLITLPLCL